MSHLYGQWRDSREFGRIAWVRGEDSTKPLRPVRVPTLLGAAHHQAAHAITVIALGGSVLRCTIRSSHFAGGQVDHLLPGGIDDAREQLWAELVTTAAGSVADTANNLYASDDLDRHAMRTLADKLRDAGGVPDPSPHTGTSPDLAAREAAARILRDHADAYRALVDELMAHRTVRGSVAHQIFADHPATSSAH